MSPISPGGARLTFYHAVEEGTTINVIRSGVTYVPSLRFDTDTGLLTDAGVYDIQFVRSGAQSLQFAELPEIELIETYYYLIALVGSGPDDLEAVVIPTSRAEVEIALGDLAAPGTIVEAVGNQVPTTEFRRAIEVADLTERLSGAGPFTVFAPVEIALDDMVMTDTEAIENIVLYHVVEGEWFASDLKRGVILTTLQGEDITIRLINGKYYINNSELIETNFPATNGVAHLIDGALRPPVAD
jgi:uncharacterized surface protein with fasciclin (FAS1) repeats